MVFELVKFLFLMIPPYVANSTPVLFSKIKALNFLDFPIDRGKTWKGRRILGDGKTVKGFVMGVFWGSVAGTALGTIKLGFALSLGTMIGDLIGSFLKRRLEVERGKSNWLLDQETFIVFALTLASILEPISWEYWLAFLAITPPIHRLANIIANRLKLKSVPF
ncbi:MAG: CDP-2,3-bis-(O-geranylgeranyl)-sn-glycerol synthase [Nanoarchaeota archaeon]|nr:CDP-2,3-bis-(O-geranylgeranyl)-sn-glycerol synthase [Nanoarchaeota archaeon]